MKKPLAFLLSHLSVFIFLLCGSSLVFGDDFQDGLDAYSRKDYKTAYKLWFPLAKQGNAFAQNNLGLMYANGRGVPQDYASAHMWFNLAGSNGMGTAMEARGWVEKKMSPSQIEKAQEMARNWKPSNK